MSALQIQVILLFCYLFVVSTAGAGAVLVSAAALVFSMAAFSALIFAALITLLAA
jgi:hypothetical protein